MNHAVRALALLIIALSGVWGCSQGPGSRAALVERIKGLEERNARLEDDVRAVAAGREAVKQKLARAEDHIQKLQQVVKERDELKVQLQIRTGERDQVAAQYDHFRKGLKDMVGQADAATLRFPDGEPVTVSISVPDYQK